MEAERSVEELLLAALASRAGAEVQEAGVGFLHALHGAWLRARIGHPDPVEVTPVRELLDRLTWLLVSAADSSAVPAPSSRAAQMSAAPNPWAPPTAGPAPDQPTSDGLPAAAGSLLRFFVDDPEVAHWLDHGTAGPAGYEAARWIESVLRRLPAAVAAHWGGQFTSAGLDIPESRILPAPVAGGDVDTATALGETFDLILAVAAEDPWARMVDRLEPRLLELDDSTVVEYRKLRADSLTALADRARPADLGTLHWLVGLDELIRSIVPDPPRYAHGSWWDRQLERCRQLLTGYAARLAPPVTLHEALAGDPMDGKLRSNTVGNVGRRGTEAGQVIRTLRVWYRDPDGGQLWPGRVLYGVR